MILLYYLREDWRFRESSSSSPNGEADSWEDVVTSSGGGGGGETSSSSHKTITTVALITSSQPCVRKYLNMEKKNFPGCCSVHQTYYTYYYFTNFVFGFF